MAVKKNTADTERVEIMVPRGAANDDPNLFISVNGKNYLLPRGKRSMVPREVADEYNRSVAAQEALDARMQAMIDAAEEASRKIN